MRFLLLILSLFFVVGCSSDYEKLLKAVEDEDFNSIERIVKSTNPSLSSAECKEVLVQSIKVDDKNIIQVLLYFCNENLELDNSLKDLVRIAVENNAYSAIDALLAYGFDPDETILNNGHTLLSWAIFTKTNEIVELCMKYNADLNGTYNDITMIQLAISREYLWVIQELITHGCDVYATNPKGHDAITFALSHRKYEIAEIIIESIDSVPDQGIQFKHIKNLLLYWNDNDEIGNTMIQAGYSLSSNQPYLQIAIKNMKFEAAYWLLDNGIDPTVEYQGILDYAKRPLDEAYGMKARMLNSVSSGFSYSENSPEIIELNKLIERLQNN